MPGRAPSRILTVEGVQAGAGLEVVDRAVEAVRGPGAAGRGWARAKKRPDPFRDDAGGLHRYAQTMSALPLSELLMMFAALIAAGAVAGVIGGLFGVGGGTVLVPALFYAFSVLGVGGQSTLHVAIGTSLLTIVANSLRSLATHRAHGAVDEVVLRTWTPWVAFGGLVGAGHRGLHLDGGAGHRLWRLLLIAMQMELLPERM